MHNISKETMGHYLGLNAEAEIQILNSICNLDALALIGVIIAQRSLSPCIFLPI